MTWVVIKFVDSEEVEVVPFQWFNAERGICLYPPYSRTLLERSIKQKLEAPPLALEEGWQEYKAQLMSDKQYDNFITANAKASKACLTSDVSDKEELLPTKRISKKKILHSETSDASSDEDNTTLSNIPTPPFRTNSQTAPYQKISTEKCQRTKRKVNDSITTFQKTSITENSSQEPIGKGDDTTIWQKTPITEYDKCQNSTGNGNNTTTYQKEMIRYLIQNKKMLEDIDKKMTNLQVDINQIKSVLAEPTLPSACKEVLDEVYSSLPIKDIEQIDVLQEKLKERKVYDSMVSYLARLGGGNYKECTRRFLTKTISDNVANLFTLHGHREGKRAFMDVTLSSLIIDAVKKNNNEVTNKLIEIQIGLWLTKAKERLTKIADKNNN